jgi:hypothetical protein
MLKKGLKKVMTQRKKSTKKSAKTPKKGTTASKKTSIEDMEQAHGKEETLQPTTLDQIWGDDGVSKYGTFSKAEYQEHIDNLNKTDLQQHAVKLGIVPVRERHRLTKNLMTAFDQHCSMYTKPSEANVNNPADIDEETLKILSEGR